MSCISENLSGKQAAQQHAEREDRDRGSGRYFLQVLFEQIDEAVELVFDFVDGVGVDAKVLQIGATQQIRLPARARRRLLAVSVW